MGHTSKKANNMSKRNYDNMLLCEETPFAIKEAFKSLRTNLMFSSRGEKTPVFVITSAHASAGKSVIAANISISFALMGKKVLLIDGDLRCPVVHRIFKAKNPDEGFSSLLSTQNPDPKNYIYPTDHENLFALYCGLIPPNPSELLASDYLPTIIDGLKKDFNIIIIDMPPVGEVTDPLLLSPITTGYIMVVRSEVSKRAEVADSISLIEQKNGKIAGIVLNAINQKSHGYGYGKYGKYSNYSDYAKAQK